MPPCMSVYPCTSVCPHTPVCSLYIMGFEGASVHPICHGDFQQEPVHWYLCQTFLSLSVYPFAPHFIMVIPVAPHHCGSLLYWTGCLWMYAQLHAVDLVLSL